MTRELGRTIVTTAMVAGPIAGGMIGMVGAFVPGAAGQVLSAAANLLGVIGAGAAGLAAIGNRNAVAHRVEAAMAQAGAPRGPTTAEASEPDAGARGPAPPPEMTPPPAELTPPPPELTPPPAELTPPPAEPTPGVEHQGPGLH